MKRARALPAAIAVALVSPGALADPFPSRGGQSGILDVPDAEIALPDAIHIGAELRYAGRSGLTDSIGPLPLSMVAGLTRNLEGGVAFREGGLPGDPRPSPVMVEGALKYRFLRPRGLIPGLAVSARLDRVNWDTEAGMRVIGSTEPVGDVRVAAYVGNAFDFSVEGGVAASWRRGQYEAVAEGFGGTDGAMLGIGARWIPSPKFGLGVGATWLPSAGDVAVGITFGYDAAGRPPPERPKAEPTAPEETDRPRRRKRRFRSPRPRFRLKIKRTRVPGEDGGVHRPWVTAPADEAPAEAAPAEAAPAEEAPAEEAPAEEAPAEAAPAEAAPAEAAPAEEPPAEQPPAEEKPAEETRPDLGPKTEEERPRKAPVERRPPRLEPGRAGAKQLQQTLEGYRPAIQRCVARYLKQEGAENAEGVLIIRVRRRSGKVRRVRFARGALSGTALETCLRDVSKNWRFPRNKKAYDVTTPIIVRVQEGGG